MPEESWKLERDHGFGEKGGALVSFSSPGCLT